MLQKFNQYINNKKAITLIELLVAMSISIILLSIITAVFIMGLKSFRAESVKSNLQIEARTTADRMSNDIRLAVAVPANLIDPVTNDQYVSNETTLILKLLAIDASNNILYDRYDYIIYIIDIPNKKIAKRTLPHIESSRQLNTADLLQNKVSNPSTFSYLPEYPPSYNINQVVTNLTVNQSVDGKTYSYSTSTRAKLRNK